MYTSTIRSVAQESCECPDVLCRGESVYFYDRQKQVWCRPGPCRLIQPSYQVSGSYVEVSFLVYIVLHYTIYHNGMYDVPYQIC